MAFRSFQKLAAFVFVVATSLVSAADVQLTVLGTYKSGVYDAGGAEIPAYDPATKRLFVVNAGSINKVDVLDISNPAAPTLVGQINPQTAYPGCSPNSVAIKKGVVAVACQDATATNNGKVLFYLASDTPATAVLQGSVDVGALPDMLVFSPDGNRLLVANEGEPSSNGAIDPEGSISILNTSSLPTTFPTTATTAGFTAFNAPAVIDPRIRIVGTNVGVVGTVAQDLEPEYITISADSKTAYVTIQEANAIAIVDIATSTVTALKSLGFKDHSLPENVMDLGDRDGGANAPSINLQNAPVKGMYQPDAIASFMIGDTTYLLTANEGDVRAANGDFEAVTVGAATLDTAKFPNAAALQNNLQLGRLVVSRVTSNTDADTALEELYSFGARSFCIWTTSINQVYDSGSDFERITANSFPVNFNASNTNNNLDNRSDDKGPEPEGCVVGVVNGKTYAFIGLERIGGVMVYDVSNPTKPVFQQYINNRNFGVTPNVGNVNTVGDLGPEGLIFIKASESPNGRPLLVVANEISGTTTIYNINTQTQAGPSTTLSPYLVAAADGVKTKSIFTTGDSVNFKPNGVTPYIFGGIPDGMGAFDNGDGTMTVLVNHEYPNTSGVARLHGGTGAYVSKLTIEKETLKVLKAEDLIRTVRTTGSNNLNRFCSADLPDVGAYFNTATGKGTRSRIFMNGEEGTDGRAFAHVVTGPEAGVSYELPKLGKVAFENVVASPFAQDATIVIGLDDSTGGQLYVYVGSKLDSGTEVEKAGLTNGALFGVKVAGAPTETRTNAVGKPKGEAVAFSLAALPDVSEFSANDLEYFSTLLDVTKFLRPEDGSWDPRNPNDFYFVTTDDFASAKNGTGSTAARSRLWRLRFTDITNPTAGGTITMLVDGTEAHQMFDNMTVDKNGNILLQEDPGGNNHNAKVWLYRIDSGTLTLIAKHDPERFGDFENGVVTPPTAPFNNNEEASGIIDASELLGKGWYLSVVQAHYSTGVTETVEGGQLVALFVPETLARPQVEEQVPQVIATAPGVEIKPVLTVGQTVNKKADQPDKAYRFVGIPDGLGAYDNGDGTFTLLMNHELPPTSGLVRAHGSTGAFVSRWIIEKSSLRVVSIQDFNQSANDIFTWNGTAYVPGTTQYQRFCSADLPPASATFNPGSGLGTPERMFFNGEEFDTGGRAFAHIATGANKGKSFQLPKLGKIGWENLLVSPFPQDKTLAMCMDDGPIDKCQLYIYVGQKSFSGNEIEKAGLTNGTLYGFKVGSVLTETQNDGLGAPKGTPLNFTLVAMDDQTNKTGVELETESDTKLLTKFFRPEDGQWDPNNPNDYYFVTTDRIDTIKDGIGTNVGRTRLWKVSFTNLTNPTAGGTITMILDGTEPTNMLDNMTIDNNGRILMQEDPGNAAHLAKIWMYDIASKQLTQVASANPDLFGDIGRPATAPFSIDEETSGIISVEDILGRGWYLLAVQAHRPVVVDKELAELGQLVAMRIPTGARPDTTAQSVSSSQSSYITPVAQGVKATAIMTTGDNAPNLKTNGFPNRMGGIPDGLGAYDNGDGSFTVLMNHEIGTTLGVTRAHGAKGAYVSKFTIDKATLQVKKLEDLIQQVVSTSGGPAIQRLCSADLPPVSAFFFSTNGNGTASRIFLSGEETDDGGRLFAHFATGPNAGTSFEASALGKIAWENALASPFAQNKTIVMGMDDASNSFSTTPANFPSEVYVYIGNKTSTGSELDKAGLTGGILTAIKTAFADEDAFVTANPTKGTAVNFTLESFGDVSNDSGLQLQTKAIAQGTMQFHRVEDGAWDPRDPRIFYFVTTNSFSTPSRLWRMRFTDIRNPELGGTLTMVLDGTEGQKMFDNLCIDKYGRILLQEDPGGNAHNAKIWSYDTTRNTLTLVAKHDVARFGDNPTPAATAPFNNNEESSGIIDASDILGDGMYLLDVQAHYTLGGELVEGGQLLAMHVPPTLNPDAPGNDQGVTTAQSSYLIPVSAPDTEIPGVQTVSILSAGDVVGKKADGSNYRFVGIPDGMGAFDNGDGTFTAVINHEIPSSQGVTRAHGGKGAFVSKLVIDKATLKVLSAEDLIKNFVFTNGTIDISRLCSADLPPVSALKSGDKGITSRVFFSGEEDLSTGRLLGHFVTGPNAGTTFELPALGKIAWENALASPFPQDKTIVMGMDDADNAFSTTPSDFPSELYMYIGNKAVTGTEIVRAGLSGGNLNTFLTAFADEDLFAASNARGVAVPFTVADLGDVSTQDALTLQTNTIAAGAMQFHRIEDGAWDPRNPNVFYFVTTNAFNSPSRLWRVSFTDITNPAAGGTLTIVLDGTEGQQMFDNMTMDGSGNILLQEDPGNNAHNAKVWVYNVDSDDFKLAAMHDPARFGNIGVAATAPFNQNEEASGIIDASEILGRGWFLSTIQAHYNIGDTELFEGGQLVALYVPGTGTPQIRLTSETQIVAEGGATNVTFGVKLDGAVASAIDIPYTLSGTATGGGVDHGLANGTITIATGSVGKNVSFTLMNDMVVENTETVVITLGTPNIGNIAGTKIHTVFITDNDGVSIGNDALAGNEDTSFSTTNVFANDGAGATLAGFSQGTNGAVVNNGNGIFNYTPVANYFGTDAFTYTVTSQPKAFNVERRLLAKVSNNGRSGELSTAVEVPVLQGGYGSAIAPVPGFPNEYYLLTDRGPNINGPSSIPNSKIFPVPTYQPRIGRFQLTSNGSYRYLYDVVLKRDDGITPLTGLPNPANAGGTGEIALAADGTQLGTDPQGFDSEGLVALANGQFWISDEYGPWIANFDSSGSTLERVGPFAANAQGHKLPAVLAKRQPNRGMEGLCITPDGATLVGAMQSTLINGNTNTSKTGTLRILFYDIATGATKQYLYLQEDLSNGNKPTGISEICAISNTEFLVLERDGSYLVGDSTLQVKKIFKINIAGATDVSDPADSASGLLVNGVTIEKLSENLSKTAADTALRAAGIIPVGKSLFYDLVPLGALYNHDKVEGLALVGNNLVLANDDDFAVGDSNGKLIVKLNPQGLVDGCEILVIPQATATVNVTVNPVNDIPSFTKGADQTVLENAGLTNVAGWATSLSAGPANEAAQTLSFTLTNTNNALFSAQPAVAANGTLTFTPAPNAFGEATVTVVLKDDGGTANGGIDTAAAQLFKITVTKVNEAPAITSILANPNPADVGQAVAFSATVTDADNDPLTYTWNWGDNTTGVGATPTKTYTAAGTYTVTLTVDDGQGGTANKTLTVNVMGAGFEMDTDGDGLSDVIEIAAGSKPDDATSVPNGVTANPTPVDLAVSKLSIKFNFAKGGTDQIMLTGSLPVADGFDLEGQTVVLSIAGIAKSFTLNDKGVSPKADSTFKFSKPKDGSAKFTAKFSKGTFADTLESAGLTNDNFAAKDNKRVDVAITVLFNGKLYKETVTQTYIAKKDGKAGTK